jgi:ureidoglycolate lyase
MRLLLEPIDAERFAAFGHVHEPPALGKRSPIEGAMQSTRPSANMRVTLNAKAPSAPPFVTDVLERHLYSTQTFLPLDVGRWIAVVAPHAASGGPDIGNARAFLLKGNQGLTYAMNVWHMPLTVLDQPGRFATTIWRDGTSGDEEFVTLSERLEILL